MAYKGYLIRRTITGEWFVEKDNHLIGWAKSVEDAKRMIDQLTMKNPSRKKSRNPGMGKGFTFHGSFQSQILARRREKEIPGSFIIKRGNRYYVIKPRRNPSKRVPVLKRYPKLTNRQRRLLWCTGKRYIKYPHRNPQGKTLIYGEVLQIWARKTSGPFKGQRFTHKFKSKPKMYGLPNGALLIQ